MGFTSVLDVAGQQRLISKERKGRYPPVLVAIIALGGVYGVHRITRCLSPAQGRVELLASDTRITSSASTTDFAGAAGSRAGRICVWW